MGEMDFLQISTRIQCELLQSLADGEDGSHLLARIADNICVGSSILQADACSIYVTDKPVGLGGRKAFARAASGYQQPFVGTWCRVKAPQDVPQVPGPREKLGLTGWVISTGMAFLARSPQALQEHPHWTGRYDQLQAPKEKLAIGSFLAVPLRDLRGNVIGALKAERKLGSEAFSTRDQVVIESLARAAGRCIAYSEDAATQRDASLTSWAREIIAEAVGTEGDLDKYLDVATQAIAAATQAEACAIFLIDENRRTLTQRAGSGSQKLGQIVRAYPLPEPHQIAECMNSRMCSPANCPGRGAPLPREKRVGLTAWVAATGKSYRACNEAELKLHCHHRGQFDPQNYRQDEEHCGAWLGVPLRLGGTVVGVLKIENVCRRGQPEPASFTASHERCLDLLAQEVVLSIERLKAQSHAHYQVIHAAMPTILGILSGEHPVPDLVKRVVEDTARLFNARACALFLNEGGRLIQPPGAAYGWATHGPSVREYKMIDASEIPEKPASKDDAVGLTVWIAAKRQSFTAKSNMELIAHPHHRGKYDVVNFDEQKKEQCESFMGMPLLLGSELIGVLKVETKMTKSSPPEFAYFTEIDELVLRLIAESAAIAIQNARLLETRRLADRIKACANNDDVLQELHAFQQGRAEVIQTLGGAAEAVETSDRSRSELTRSFAAVLVPGFNPAVLISLSSELRGPARDLLALVSQAIRSADLQGIRGMRTSGLRLAEMLGGDFFLRDMADQFHDAMVRVRELLQLYDEDPSVQAPLQSAVDVLTELSERASAMDLFERSLLGRVCECWIGLLQAELLSPREILNPYNPGAAVGPQSNMFFGRQEVFLKIERELCRPDQKLALMLHGPGRVGKTSVLLQILSGQAGARLRERRQRPLVPVLVDMETFSSTTTGRMLLYIAERIRTALTARKLICPAPDQARLADDPFGAFYAFLEAACSALPKGRDALLVLLLDEFWALADLVRLGQVDPGIFRFIRSIVQSLSPVTFVFAGRRPLLDAGPDDGAELSAVCLSLELGFLADGDAERLIRQPVAPFGITYDGAVVSRILSLSGGHPCLIQQLCYGCIESLGHGRRRDSRDRRVVDMSALDEAAPSVLLDVGQPVFTALWDGLGDVGQVLMNEIVARSRSSVDGAADTEWLPAAIEKIGDESRARHVLDGLLAQRLVREVESAGAPGARHYCAVGLLTQWLKRQHIVEATNGED